MKVSTISVNVDALVLPNLDAAYQLARWRVRNAREAEDIVYEASVRAARLSPASTGQTDRAWFLRIVREVCDERYAHDQAAFIEAVNPKPTGHALKGSSIEEAIRRLPPHLREVLVLRELEGLSYQELADVTGTSVEAVTGRLSQSRRALTHSLAPLSAAG